MKSKSSSRRSWRSVDEQQFKREQYGVIISLLQHADWHDLAHVAALRAAGERVRIAIVSGSEHAPMFEIIENEAKTDN